MADTPDKQAGQGEVAGKKQKGEKQVVDYQDVHFDVAKTSRGKCSGCGVGLAEGEDRIAKEVNSQHGKIVKSYHPSCGITILYNEDNRSKCATCGEKLVLGDYRVKVGCSTKSGPGTKHHFSCLMEKGSNDQERLAALLLAKKEEIKEEDRPVPVDGPKKKKKKVEA